MDNDGQQDQTQQEDANAPAATSTSASMTSKDYYFDSYSHFGQWHRVKYSIEYQHA